MMHFKNHKYGFTLIEVLFAMMIASLTLTPFFSMLATVLSRVNKASRAYDYSLLCKNFLYEARQKQEPDAQEFSLEKKEIEFDASLTYFLDKDVDVKSTLKSIQGLHKETVTISWEKYEQKNDG